MYGLILFKKQFYSKIEVRLIISYVVFDKYAKNRIQTLTHVKCCLWISDMIAPSEWESSRDAKGASIEQNW